MILPDKAEDHFCSVNGMGSKESVLVVILIVYIYHVHYLFKNYTAALILKLVEGKWEGGLNTYS